MMSAATTDKTAEGPLKREHHEQLALANQRAKKIRRAAGVAAFNGWAMAICAVISAPFALFSFVGLLITVSLALLAANEFRGRKGLLRFDLKAPEALAWNQLALLTIIVLYCAWTLYTSLSGGGALANELKAYPELSSSLDSVGGIDQLVTGVVVAVYGSVIVLSIIFQGLNAFYYFSCRKHIEAYVNETPEWIIELQRSSV